jgi:hypothetical protein
MKARLPLGLILVAALQFVAPLTLPPAMLQSISPALWGVVAALFVLLGLNLLRRRAWSRVASIFVQGFNIIVRLLVMISHGVTDGVADTAMLSTFMISILLSAVILYYIDQPDVQVIMQ